MGFLIPGIISGVGALAGLLGNRPKTTEQTQDITKTDTQNMSSSGTTGFQNQGLSTPTYDPFQLQMRDFILGSYYNRLDPNRIAGLVGSTIGQGVNNINQGYDTANQALNQNLAERGLSYSAMPAQSQLQGQRVSNILGLRNQAPLLQEQLQGQALTDFGSFLRGLPTGMATTQSGTGTQDVTGTSTDTMHQVGKGTNTDPGNMLGGATQGLASMLGYLYGQGAFGNTKKAPSMGNV